MAKEQKLSFTARLIQQAIGQDLTIGNENDEAAVKWPALWEWLSTVYVGRDYVKTPPTVSISLIPNGVSVRINDRDLARNLEITCPNLAECFDRLEEALQSPGTMVKTWGKKEPKLRKRQK